MAIMAFDYDNDNQNIMNTVPKSEAWLITL